MGMPAIEEFFQGCKARIFAHTSHGDNAVTAAILRKHDHACLCCIGYPFDFDFLAVYLYRTAVNGVKPEQTAHHFRTPCADQPCKANDFALAYMEGYILKQLTALEVFYLKQRLPNLNILLGIYVFHTATYHQRDNLVNVCILRTHTLYNRTVTEYRNIIRNAEYLIHLMRDINNRTALCLQKCNLLKQQLNLLLRNGGRRLVHNNDRRIVGDCLQDFQHLNIGGSQRFQLIRCLIGQMLLLQQPFGFFAHLAPFNSAHPIHRQASQKNIFLYGHFGNIVQLLRNHGNSERSCHNGIFDFHRFLIHKNFAGIRLINPVDNFHQCRLARAVFTAQRMYSPFSDCKVDFIQSLYTRKRFFDF